MDLGHRELDYSRHRLSASEEERTIFYIEDMSPPGDQQQLQDLSPTSERLQRYHQQNRLCEPPDLGLLDQQHQHQHQQQSQPQVRSGQQRRRNSSISGGSNGTDRPRRQRRPSECVEGRMGGRARANSCARSTPLGKVGCCLCGSLWIHKLLEMYGRFTYSSNFNYY